MNDYPHFGEKWRKQMRKMNKITILDLVSDQSIISKKSKKDDIISVHRQELLCKTFNEQFNIGNTVAWREDTVSEYKMMTVNCKAYMNNGRALVFFKEKPAYCSIDSIFLLYKYYNVWCYEK